MELTVIVRSAYERTEDLCRRLIQQQVSSDQVVVIHEKPFSSALRCAYEIGLDSNRRWTLRVDADVLLRNNAITTLLQSAEAAEKDVLLVKGLILDKLFGGPRPAGVHLYRSQMLEEAIKYIPEEGIDLRPEN